MAETVSRVSLSLPPSLLQKFDRASDQAGFKDRSKAIQAMMRSFLTEQMDALSGPDLITGALLVIYDHEVRGVDSALTDLEHRNRGVIASSTHMHLGVRVCLKVLVVRGKMSEVRVFEKNLRHQKGVMQLKLSLMKTEAD